MCGGVGAGEARHGETNTRLNTILFADKAADHTARPGAAERDANQSEDAAVLAGRIGNLARHNAGTESSFCA